MPRPAKADIRCSTVETRAPSFSSTVAMRRVRTLRASRGNRPGCRAGRSGGRRYPFDRRGPQRHLDLRAGVQPHAGGADEGLEGALTDHGALIEKP